MFAMKVKMQLITKLVVWLGWLCNIGLAQFELSETLTGSATFPDLGITCIGNVAVFITSILRGRLDREIGARDVLATLRGPKLKHINGLGLTTCKNQEYKDASVVMLSAHQANSSISQFMKFISYAYNLQSILLQYRPLESAQISPQIRNCNANICNCKCIVFWTVEEMTILLARRLPGTLKRLSDSLCLIPSLDCLRNGCHGCNQGLLHVEETNGGQRLEEGGPMVEPPAAVCDMISWRSIGQEEERMCICIPLHPACDDEWTKMLIRSFRCKDKAGRGIRVMTSDALENYMGKSGICSALEKYNPATLLVPRLAELLINIKLTEYFGVDGFSSSLVARRAIRNYLVDSTGTGFVANAFVTEALVKSNGDNTNVCQVLNFTSSFLSLRTLSLMIGCVNLICSIGWALLLAFEGHAGKWYEIRSMSPSKLRVVVITAAIGIALGMDCLHLYLGRFHRKVPPMHFYLGRFVSRKVPPMLWAVIVLEIGCILCASTLLGVLGINVFGKWIYSALQGLVWVKWGIGSYLLAEYSPEYDYKVSGLPSLANHYSRWTDDGILVYSSAFFLNAILAGVRGKWDYFPATN